MTLGPVEYVVVAFPGNKFTGNIAPALADLVEAGTIRVMDLAFVTKDADGAVVGFELTDLDQDEARVFDGLGGDGLDLISAEDLAAVGEELEPNSSAAMLVWENTWATKFAEALREADGELLDHDRIPHEVLEAALDWAKDSRQEEEVGS
jgi:GTPase SAR1 family protein